MAVVRIENNEVMETIPEYALPPEKWYGAKFAACCIDAPDEVKQGWIYDQALGQFSPPPEPSPAPTQTVENDLLSMAVDHEYRLTILELGVV